MRVALNKSSLSRQSALLRTFRQFLPSLDLKRRQLMRERAQARAALLQTQRAAAAIPPQVRERLPMLADDDVDLRGLARVDRVETGEENVVGVRLPTLLEVVVAVRPYGLLAKPHWVDVAAALLAEELRLAVREQVEARRLALLERAVRVVTQRVNLFEKVLIPRAEATIKQIKIYLADAERAAVVRAKIAKRKKQRAR